jgi:hypothetical protein
MKKTIMKWCVDNWPAAINDTKTPALWWWTPRKAQRWLENADFDQFWDRWELRARQSSNGVGSDVARLISRVPVARFVGNVIVPGCAYAARKKAPR